MENLEYTTIDRVLSKLYRDLKEEDLNESDVIEWAGEALSFMKVPGLSEQMVSFLEVKDFEVSIPTGLQMILQIARDNEWSKSIKTEYQPVEDKEEMPPYEVGNFWKYAEKEYHWNHRPSTLRFNLRLAESIWANSSVYKNRFSAVRLANHTFFNSIVCKNKYDIEPCYQNCDEYTIVGTAEKKLRFSFKEGLVAVAYLRTALDAETGYPMIPDNIDCISAITYYIKWKIAEQRSWQGREGYINLGDRAEQRWIKHLKQFKNHMKMPKSIDDYQDLLEQSYHIVPDHKKYFRFFGNMGELRHIKDIFK